MTKDDVVIIAGDFGGVWLGDSRDDEALDWLENLPFTVAFIDGNHENFDALTAYPIEEWHSGKVQRIRPHVLHLMRGQVYELAGYRFFTMGGAKSHDIEDGILKLDDPNFERKLLMMQRRPNARYRINHITWWRQGLPTDEEYNEALQNLERCDWQVDYIITHCAPTSIAYREFRHNEADRLTDFLFFPVLSLWMVLESSTFVEVGVKGRLEMPNAEPHLTGAFISNLKDPADSLPGLSSYTGIQSNRRGGD